LTPMWFSVVHNCLYLSKANMQSMDIVIWTKSIFYK
jgi:hypothetical protein